MIAITTTRIGFNQDLVFLIPLLLYTPKSFVNITGIVFIILTDILYYNRKNVSTTPKKA